MKKMILIISVIIVILLQAFVLANFFISRYNVIFNGEKLKFLVEDFDLSRAKANGYIEINLSKEISGKGEYGIIKIDDNGFAELSSVALQQPNFGMYVKSDENEYFNFPVDKYYLKNLKNSEEETKKLIITEETKIYILTRIKDGEMEVTNFCIDGVDIEEYIEN